MRLESKTAIVTGAASGFGAGIACLFAAEGASVLIADINDSDGRALAAQIERTGARASYVHADVSLREDTQAMMAAALELDGRIDILVNNAGFSHRKKSILEVTEEEFDRVFAVNVKAIYLAVQEVLPVFRRQGGGCIVNTSSTAAMRPRPDLSVYNSSKGAVNTLTKSLAVELAPERIRVNAVCPVIGETALLETFMGVADTPENRRAFEATIPLGRFSRPEDIARAALFLAGDDAEFITGVTLEVDGGRCV